ncbi:stress response translation initiation inhibitor YciH [Candidatus Micrarchaeota archaeon]|nr:stress response translation initiation inhibitor YciH [Candidatus Micrarchaeota archaeon]MBU2476121.1 stress response translation initiation inhibitor YciH [Candidatus Micrarchaeota archaeon]
MNEVCPTCGLQKNLCVCDEIAKEKQRIRITIKRTKFRKVVTAVQGLESPETAKNLEKILKKKFACGGTVKGNEIELQGDHRKKIKEVLLNQGYKEELIDV